MHLLLSLSVQEEVSDVLQMFPNVHAFRWLIFVSGQERVMSPGRRQEPWIFMVTRSERLTRRLESLLAITLAKIRHVKPQFGNPIPYCSADHLEEWRAYLLRL